jgi:hypothetical protein
MFRALKCVLNPSIRRGLLTSTFAFTLFVNPIHAGTIPGRWEKVEQLQVGDSISVILISGELLEGSFEGFEGDALNLGLRRSLVQLERTEIYRVTASYAEKDNPVTGALWGLAGGAAFGAVLVATDGSAAIVSDPGGSGFTGRVSSGTYKWENEAAIVLGSAAIGSLFGFLIDVSVDPMEVRHEVVYQAM